MPLHDAARGFAATADLYQRARPDYPPAALDALWEALRLGAGAPVLELGAGTGKLSRLLAARGARVIGVEPVAAMRARLRSPGVLPVGAIAEALPLRAGAARAAVAATAFHWFDGPRALAELHRALAPGGRLALAWNVRDERVEWIARLSAIVNRAERGGAPRYRSGRWREAFGAAPGPFGPLHEARFEHVHALPPEGVVERVASVSFIAALAPRDRRPILDEVRALLATHPDTAGREEVGLAYVTDLYWCERG